MIPAFENSILRCSGAAKGLSICNTSGALLTYYHLSKGDVGAAVRLLEVFEKHPFASNINQGMNTGIFRADEAGYPTGEFPSKLEEWRERRHERRRRLGARAEAKKAALSKEAGHDDADADASIDADE